MNKTACVVTLQQGTRLHFLQAIGNCLFVIKQINDINDEVLIM